MIFPFLEEERREPSPWWVGFHLSEVQDLADELASYDRDFETAKIWVGKQARQTRWENTVGYGWEKGHGKP